MAVQKQGFGHVTLRANEMVPGSLASHKEHSAGRRRNQISAPFGSNEEAAEYEMTVRFRFPGGIAVGDCRRGMR